MESAWKTPSGRDNLSIVLGFMWKTQGTEKMNRLLLSFLILIALNASGQTSDTSLVCFWTSFQKAIIDQDYKVLSSKTTFPLKAQGQLEIDTLYKYEKKDFKKIFSKFLADEIFVGGQSVVLIIRYNFLKTCKLDPKYVTDKWARIDDMEFEKRNGKWSLTLIYDGHSKY